MVISLGLLALALVMGIWSPVGAFWATCAAIPLVFQPVSIGSANVSLLELGILVSVVGVTFDALFGKPITRFRRWLKAGRDRYVWLGAGLLIVAGAISLRFQPDRDHVQEALRTYRWVVLEGIAAFVAARFAIQRRGARPVVVAIVAPALAVAAIALADVIWSGDGFQADGVTRATATYLHPNNLALYLERAFVLALGILILSGADRTRAWMVTTALIGCGLMATLSRGMLPAIAVGLLIIGWFAGKRSVVYATGGGLLVALAVFALVAGDRLMGNNSSGVLGARRDVWSAAVRMIADYPVSGIGMDQFLYQHNPRYIAPEAWSERYLSHPHNIVLDSWLSLGLPGLLLLAAFLVGLAACARAIQASTDPQRPARAAAIAAIMAGLVHGLVDNAYFLPDLAAFTWILIAVAIGDSESARARTLPPKLIAWRDGSAAVSRSECRQLV